MPRSFHRTCLAAAALVAVLTGGVGCAGPAIEGVLADRPFAIAAGTPQRLGTDVDPILVFFEADDVTATLRTVSLALPAVSSLPRGEPIVVGSGVGGPQVEVIEGVLQRLDGDLLSSTDDRTTAHGAGGVVVIDDGDDDVLSGEFRVDLDDGGYVAGRFVSVR